MWWSPGPLLEKRMQVESREHSEARKSCGSFFSQDKNDTGEFLAVLEAKFGTLTRAWHNLDADRNGLVDMREFVQALRGIGYTGHLRTLWFNLDDTNDGYISLKELDPEAAAALEKFRLTCTLRYDSIEAAWHTCIDKTHANNVPLNKFRDALLELGYTSSDEIERLFDYLRPRPGARSISISDIDFLQNWEETKRLAAYRKRFPSSWTNRDPYRFVREGDAERLQELEEEDAIGIDLDKEVDNFKAFLIDHFGNLAKAFETMDSNGNGSLSMSEFQYELNTVLRYCRRTDAMRLFNSLTGPGKHKELTFSLLGVSPTEWAMHKHEKRHRQRLRESEARAQRLAPLGASPRQTSSLECHHERVQSRGVPKHPTQAFGDCLPPGWGLPPAYDPPPMKSLGRLLTASGTAAGRAKQGRDDAAAMAKAALPPLTPETNQFPVPRLGYIGAHLAKISGGQVTTTYDLGMDSAEVVM